MTEQTIIRISGFDNLSDLNQTIIFGVFNIRFENNNCLIIYPDNHSWLNNYQLEWIISLMETFFKYPIINEIVVRNPSSLNDFSELLRKFHFFESRYDDTTNRDTDDYQNKVLPFIYALSWFHKAHKVFSIDPTLSFLSLLTSLDALNGDNEGTVGEDFKNLIMRYNTQITPLQTQRLYKIYRCKIVHQGKELQHDIFHRTLERDMDFVTRRLITEIFRDNHGEIRTREGQMNQDIVGDITYNYLYKIVSNCLIGYLDDYFNSFQSLQNDH